MKTQEWEDRWLIWGGRKLNQVDSEICETKLNQAASENPFSTVFAYVPWMHHILIVQKCKTIPEALFYIKRTIGRIKQL